MEQKLTEDQILRKIDKLPNFLEYLSYIHFFGSSLCGPTFEFYDYVLFINQQKEFQQIPLGGCLKQIGKLLLRTAFFMFFAVVVLPKFPIGYLATDEFSRENYFYRVFFLQMSIILIKFRYYSGWTLAEAGITSTGFTYLGKDSTGALNWTRTKSSNPEVVELSSNFQTKVGNWNMSIQTWLKKYVYFRIYSEKEIKMSKKK